MNENQVYGVYMPDTVRISGIYPSTGALVMLRNEVKRIVYN